MLTLCWTSSGWRFFLKIPLNNEWLRYQYGSTSWFSVPPDEFSAEILVTLFVCEPSSITFGQGKLEAVQPLAVGCRAALCHLLPPCDVLFACGRVGHSSAGASSVLCSRCVPAQRDCGVTRCVLCSLPQGLLWEVRLSPFPIHQTEHWGCVVGLWASGILCFWQLGVWGTCRINSSCLVPPCSAVWFAVLLVQAEPH